MERLRTIIAAIALLPLLGAQYDLGSRALSFTPLPVPLENWKSQEGSGTTLNNSGTNSTNSATTNVAWSSATGFTGTVATYNGTSSISNSSSATSTGFDGTTPFSGCAWVNVTLPSGTSEVVFFSNLSSATGNPGFTFRLFGAVGVIELWLINNDVSSNLILARQDSASIPRVVTGSLTFVCFTYDGSKTAAGVKLYVNGTSVTTNAITNGLTGSMASTVPVSIGADASSLGDFITGSVGRVRIWNSVLSAATISALNAAGPNGQ